MAKAMEYPAVFKALLDGGVIFRDRPVCRKEEYEVYLDSNVVGHITGNQFKQLINIIDSDHECQWIDKHGTVTRLFHLYIPLDKRMNILGTGSRITNRNCEEGKGMAKALEYSEIFKALLDGAYLTRRQPVQHKEKYDLYQPDDPRPAKYVGHITPKQFERLVSHGIIEWDGSPDSTNQDGTVTMYYRLQKQEKDGDTK